MASRHVILAGLVGASIAAPYLMSQTPGGAQPTNWPFASAASDQIRTAARPDPWQTPMRSPGTLGYESTVPLEGLPMRSLADALRFDLTKEWVYSNWARKSTGLSDPELFGVRVPLVTGTGTADVAGSLTYYFNDQNQLQHIKLFGRTGDTTELVRFLVDTYEFQQVPAGPGEQLFQVKRGRGVQSQLRTRPEPVLWASSPHASFTVELELERPGSSRTLPPPKLELNIPEVAAAAPPAADAAAAAESGEPKPSLVGKVRAATPAEQRQLLRSRWPN